jgi:hypothetical protein
MKSFTSLLRKSVCNTALCCLCLSGASVNAAVEAFPSATQHESGWWYQSDFDWYWEFGGNWLWSYENGFLYTLPGGDWDGWGVYFWDHGMQRWFWSNSRHYPNLYAWGSDEGWQKVNTRMGPGERFFHMEDGSDETVFEDGYVVTGTVRTVTSSSTFNTAVANSVAGDVIIVNTSLPTTSLSVSNKKITSGYVRIKAGSIGVTEIKSMTFTNCSGLIFEGFKIGPNTAGTLTKVVNSTNIKILRNSFDHTNISASQSTIVTTQGTDTIEIAYNSFTNKNVGTVSGSYIKNQWDDPQMTKNMHVHHNYFQNIVPEPSGSTFAGDSDRECIVLGISDSQDVVTNHIIEYNLFEDCDGENEIITVKTSANVIRYNTFKNCLGSVSVRFGTQTEVYGNYFFADSNNQNAYPGDTGGVRVYGSYHKIYNNFFKDLTGTTWRIPILLDGGDTNDSTGGDGHEKPTYCEVANNTIVNCAWGIGFGINYTKAPQYNKVANNIVQNSTNSLFYVVKTDSTNTFEGNIANPTGTATVGVTKTTDEIWNVDPLLIAATSNGYAIFRLGAGSPAINYAKGTYSYVVQDMDGQYRYTPDCGADEYWGGSVNQNPLTTANVGLNPQ